MNCGIATMIRSIIAAASAFLLGISRLPPPARYASRRSMASAIGNIYTTWVNYPQYYSRLMNLSGGCLYFDYSTSCYIGGTDGIYGNTQNECSAIFSNFSVSEVAGEAYNNFGWNTTFAIYKILGRK